MEFEVEGMGRECQGADREIGVPGEGVGADCWRGGITLLESRRHSWRNFVSFIRVSCIAVVILIVSGSGAGCDAQDKPSPYAAEYPNSAEGLKSLFQDIIVAAMSRDTKKETELIRSLLLPQDTPWFKEVFGPDLSEQASSDYKGELADIESRLRRVVEGDIREGKIALTIKTITDAKGVDPPIVNILHDMEPLQALYEVNLSGNKQQEFDLQFDSKGRSFQSSGDPNGYFFYINGGFRFVPTNALLSLPNGRPEPGHKEPPRPKLIHAAAAPIPEAARRAKVSGTVRMHLVVDAKGKVIKVTVKEGDPLLVKAAEDCVRKWLFKPPMVDGKPIQSEIDAEVSFQVY